MGRTVHACVMLLAVTTAATAAAADGRDGDAGEEGLERLSLEELMHVRVRSPTLTSQSVETVPSMISVITHEQFRLLGLRTLTDALELLPGVTVLETSSGARRVAIRGQDDPNDVLVTLDGERLNDFYDGSFPTEMPLENVDRIELIRGPGSALYGTNAFAGVISIFSRTRERELFGGVGGELFLDHSAGGGARAYAKLARPWRRFTVRLFGSYWESTGPRVLVTRDNADSSYSKVPGETNGALRVGLAQLSITREGLLLGHDALELWSAFFYRRLEPAFGLDNVFAPGGSLERSAFFVRLAYRAPLAHGIALDHRFHFDRRHTDNLIEDEPPGYFHEVDGNFTREPGELFPQGMLRAFSFTTYRIAESGQLQWRVPHPRGIVANQLVVGGELEYAWLPDFAYGQNFCCGGSWTWAGPTLQNWEQVPLRQQHKDRLLAATFVHDQLQPWKWLWITAGLRLDWFSDFGATWNPRVGLVARPIKKISLKLLYGRAFRAPTFRDLYDQTGVSETAGGLLIQGNPKLGPQTTQTLETGFESTPWQLLTVRADAFYIETSDVIDVDTTFTVGGASVINFPGVRHWGGEAEAQLHVDEANYLSANVSYFESTQLGPGIPGYATDAERRFISTRLDQLPRLRINAVAVAAPLSRLHLPRPLAGLTIGLSYRYVAGLANDNRFTFEALSVFRQPPFHELRGNVVVPLWGGRLELNATVDLAFDRTVAVPLAGGWYDLPTNAVDLFVGARVRQ